LEKKGRMRSTKLRRDKVKKKKKENDLRERYSGGRGKIGDRFVRGEKKGEEYSPTAVSTKAEIPKRTWSR